MPRKKGIPNKTTADSKRVLVEILEGQSSNLEVALKEVFESDKRSYLASNDQAAWLSFCRKEAFIRSSTVQRLNPRVGLMRLKGS